MRPTWTIIVVCALLATPWPLAAREDDPPLSPPTDPLPPAIESPAAPAATPRPRRTIPSRVVVPPRSSLPPLEPTGPRPDPDLNPPRFVRNPQALTLEPDDDPQPGDSPKADPEPPRPAPPRRFRLFGRRPPRERVEEAPRDTKPTEPRSDPAADAAAKRLLERRVAEVAGDKVRDVEVLVVDRRVVIRARVTRFWQRRAARRAIESLPELAGYRASVDLAE